VSIAELRSALDTLVEASCCSGNARVREVIALSLPDGDVGTVDDAIFIDWLDQHAEPAPYGQGTVTKTDPKVRSARRLTARGEVNVHGFDPATILPEIEAVMSPTRKLSAQLTDVIIYKKGDKFTRHKDTPRSADLIGTLIVGLPIQHTGGTFVVDDGRGAKRFDWSGPPAEGVVPWVALFSDVDHEIEPVKSGTRITLVYALHRTTEPRSDVGATHRQDVVRRAASALSQQGTWPVMIACGRQVIAEPGAEQPQAIESLRGADRDIADALVQAGYHVAVRACIAGIPNYNDPPRWPATPHVYTITRLNTVPPAELLANMDDEGLASEILEYMLDSVAIEQCAIRSSAAAMLVHEHGCWAEDGQAFGNEGYEALLYTFAALEVSKAKPASAAKLTPAPKAKSKAKPKAKSKPTPKAKSKPTPKAKSKPKAKAKPRRR
jgi:hypothetical protein